MRPRGKIIAAQNRFRSSGFRRRNRHAHSFDDVGCGGSPRSRDDIASAAPTGIAAMPNATPLTQLVQDNYYGSYTTGWGWGYGYNFTPACPAHYHYSCWPDPYGYRHCGCLLNSGW